MNKQFDLEERTAKYGEKLILFLQRIPQSPLTNPLITQCIKSGTSLGANYYEANGASSKKDFKNKIYICKKESKETCYWLRMMAKAVPSCKDEARVLWQEANEFTKIFGKSLETMKKDN